MRDSPKMAPASEPVCSIIIPQYGRADLTVACLESLFAHVVPFHRIEILIVDDASPDDAVAVVQARFGDRVRLVVNPTNCGFAATCNRGASEARSPILVFLNNDTRSQDDWLTPVLEAVQRPEVGIVGVRLLYPDGTLQHAGVEFVSTPQEPWIPVHRLLREPGDHPDALRSGPVLAVTGACLAVRREVFWALGGFDEQYVNDLEDIDLCLTARARGYGVWYEGRACLIHDEAQTRGVDPARNARMLARFCRKWWQHEAVAFRLPPPPARAPHEARLNWVVLARNNRALVWWALQAVATWWRTEDRVVVVYEPSSDATDALVENVARSNAPWVHGLAEEVPSTQAALAAWLTAHGFGDRPTVVWATHAPLAESRWAEVLASARAQLQPGQVLVFDDPYDPWVRGATTDDGQEAAVRAMAQWRYQPRISVVMPVYNADPAWLTAAIASVRRQWYSNWELCIADDGSTRPEVRTVLEAAAREEPRLRIVRLPERRGIVAASNAAVALANGEYVAFLDHDDVLREDALWQVVRRLQDAPWDVLYSDEDQLDDSGHHVAPFFKPDWSPEYLWSCNYINHLTVYRKALGDAVGWFRAGYDGAQDYDLLLRVTERTNRVTHVPAVLCHWRRAAGSVAHDPQAKPYAFAAGLRALNDAVERRGLPATVEPTALLGHYRVVHCPSRCPVSLVVAGKGSEVLDNLPSGLDGWPVEVIRVPERGEELPAPSGPGILAAFRRGAQRARGDVLVFLHGDAAIETAEWLSELVGWAQWPGVGPVGARVLQPDGRIEQAGLVLGVGGGVEPAFAGLGRDEIGPFGALRDVRNVSAVGAVLLAVRRSVYEAVGGWGTDLPSPLGEVDFCLRARQAGYRTVVTPWVEVIHHAEGRCIHPAESPTAVAALRAMWGSALDQDPYYNPNLSRRPPLFLWRGYTEPTTPTPSGVAVDA